MSPHLHAKASMIWGKQKIYRTGTGLIRLFDVAQPWASKRENTSLHLNTMGQNLFETTLLPVSPSFLGNYWEKSSIGKRSVSVDRVAPHCLHDTWQPGRMEVNLLDVESHHTRYGSYIHSATELWECSVNPTFGFNQAIFHSSSRGDVGLCALWQRSCRRKSTGRQRVRLPCMRPIHTRMRPVYEAIHNAAVQKS